MDQPAAAAPSEDQRWDSLASGLLSDKAPEAPAAADPVSTPQANQADPAPAAAAEAEATEPEFQSVEDYLSHAKLEPDSFYQLPVTVKIDGKTSTVPLKDVLKSYQLEGHVQEKSRALADQQRDWEAQRQQAQQALGAQLQQAQTLGNLAHQQLLADYQGINWNQLRIEDPAGWAVKNQEFQNRANQIAGHLNQVQQHQQQLAAQQQQELTSKVIPAEQERMYESRPEWRDNTKFQADTASMKQYAQTLGFKPAELAGIYDHRIMLALHDAARYAALQAKKPETLNRVRAAPIATQPGARITRDPKVAAFQQAKETLKRNPRSTDAQAEAFERIASLLN